MYAAAGANNLNGSGGGSHGRRQVMSSMDFYRRVPKDLTEVRFSIFLFVGIATDIRLILNRAHEN